MTPSYTIEGYIGEVGEESLDFESNTSSIVYQESSHGFASCSIISHVHDIKQWDRVIDYPTTPIWVRWSLGIREGREIFGAWKKVYFSEGKIQYRRDSCELRLEGFDYGYFLAENSRNKVFKNMRVSEMVESIAEAQKIKEEFVECEETDGKLTLYQCGESDFQFISKSLLSRAVSVGGRSDYYFFTRDGYGIVFRSPDLSKDSKFTIYVAPSEPLTGVADQPGVEIYFSRGEVSSNLSWACDFQGFDSEKKVPLHFTAVDNTVVSQNQKLAPNSPYVDGVSRNVQLPSDLCEPSAIPRMFMNRGKAIWSRHYRDRFSVRLTATPVFQIYPLDIVDCVIRTVSGDHFLSGRYLIHSVTQRVSKVSFDTILDLRRRECR